MKRIIVCLSCLILFCRLGFAQNKVEQGFYIVLNSLTKRCTVMDKMPRTDTPNIMLASDAIYKTKADADAAIKGVKACNQ